MGELLESGQLSPPSLVADLNRYTRDLHSSSADTALFTLINYYFLNLIYSRSITGSSDKDSPGLLIDACCAVHNWHVYLLYSRELPLST